MAGQRSGLCPARKRQGFEIRMLLLPVATAQEESRELPGDRLLAHALLAGQRKKRVFSNLSRLYLRFHLRRY